MDNKTETLKKKLINLAKQATGIKREIEEILKEMK